MAPSRVTSLAVPLLFALVMAGGLAFFVEEAQAGHIASATGSHAGTTGTTATLRFDLTLSGGCCAGAFSFTDGTGGSGSLSDGSCGGTYCGDGTGSGSLSNGRAYTWERTNPNGVTGGGGLARTEVTFTYPSGGTYQITWSNCCPSASGSFSVDIPLPLTLISFSGAVGDSPWYNGDVETTLDCTTPTGGTCGSTHYKLNNGPPTTYVGPFTMSAEGLYSIEYWSIGGDGNSEEAKTTSVGIDNVAPVITAESAPAANAAGWNNENVVVSFSCTTGPSGISTLTDAQSVATEGAGQSRTGSCVSRSGLSASATASIINIDKSSPIVTATATPAPNPTGWNNEDVTVSFGCFDDLSGVDVVSGDQLVTDDGAGQSRTGSCTDIAGNSASATANGINIDQTAPAIAFESRTAANANGWNSGDATVHWNCSDALSGIVEPVVFQQVTTEGEDQTATGTCTDAAGNTASATEQGINIDTTNPVIAFDSRTAANANGWNAGDVTVNWACSDALSGIVVASDAQTVATEGENQAATGSCADLAGNMATDTQTNINIDLTAPQIYGTRSPDANVNGWNNEGVTVSFSCTDALSGVDTSSDPSTLEDEGADQSASGTCSDLAGNSVSTTVGDIRIDNTNPVVELDDVPDTEVWYDAPVTVGYHCSDALSGPDQDFGGNLDAETQGEGTEVPATALCVDAAGNAAQTDVTYMVDMTAPVIATSDVVVPGLDSTGTVVKYGTPQWTDNLAGDGDATCAPASGAIYPTGNTTVDCTAADLAGNVGHADFTVQVVAQVPHVLENLTAETGPGVHNLSLAWEAPAHDGGAEVLGYNVYRDGALIAFIDAPQDSLLDTGLLSNTSYTYEVGAVNLVGEGERLNATARTLAPPVTPTNLTATTTLGGVVLTWTESTTGTGGPNPSPIPGADPEASGEPGGLFVKYRVYRHTSNGPELIGITLQPRFTDSECPLGVSCVYSVVAFNEAGESGHSGTAEALGVHPSAGVRPLVLFDEDGAARVGVDGDGDGAHDPGEPVVRVPASP